MHFLKDFRKLTFGSKHISSQLKIKHFFGTNTIRAEFNKKMQEGKYYSILGFGDNIQIRDLSDNDVKRNYLGLVRKYHSDNIVDPLQKVEYEEITKCIILAYEKVVADRIEYQIKTGTYQEIYQDEDYVAEKLFGKKFNQIKYQLYKQQNEQKRKMFMQELSSIRKQSRYYQYVKKQEQSTSFRQQGKRTAAPTQKPEIVVEKVEKAVQRNSLYIFSGLGVLAVFFMFRFNDVDEEEKENKMKGKHTLGQEKIKDIEKKSIQLYEKKLNDLINSFVEQMPPSLKYPSRNDPQQIDQLLEYTISQDVNFYQIPSQIMAQQGNLQRLKLMKTLQQTKRQFGQEFNPYPMTKVKVNSGISLSLQAERCLQNIYIKVKDVAEEIEETGKYTPPKVFFRFYGYLMFEIRQKPLSLQNYRNTEYISLFDLFFDYYSPIPIKRHEFNEYVVGREDQDLKMYGQVHLNHRKIPQRYIGRDDKVVVMRDQVGMMEHKYEEIWKDFYRKYMKVWRRGYSDRISTTHCND